MLCLSGFELYHCRWVPLEFERVEFSIDTIHDKLVKNSRLLK